MAHIVIKSVDESLVGLVVGHFLYFFSLFEIRNGCCPQNKEKKNKICSTKYPKTSETMSSIFFLYGEIKSLLKINTFSRIYEKEQHHNQTQTLNKEKEDITIDAWNWRLWVGIQYKMPMEIKILTNCFFKDIDWVTFLALDGIHATIALSKENF